MISLYKARMLGPVAYGEVAAALSLLSFTGLACTLGLPVLAVREAEKQPEVVPQLVGLSILLAILGLVVSTSLALSVAVVSSGIDPRVVLAYAITPLAGALNFEWLFRYWRQSHVVGIIRLCNAIAQGIFLVTVGRMYGWTAVSTGIAGSVAAALVAAIVVVVVARRIRVQVPNYLFVKEQLTSATIVLAGLVAQTVNFSLDQVMLALYGFKAELGQYRAAYQIMLAVNSLGGYMIYVAYPRLVKRRISEGVGTELLYVMLSAALPLAVGGAMVAPSLVQWLLGAAFVRSASYLRVLFTTIVALYPSMVYGHFLLVNDKELLQMVSVAIGAMLNTALNVIMIPRWGALGAAWSTVITEAVVLIVAAALLSQACGLRFRLGMRLFRPLAASAGMGLILYPLTRSGIDVPLVVAVAIVAYGLLYTLLHSRDLLRVVKHYAARKSWSDTA